MTWRLIGVVVLASAVGTVVLNLSGLSQLVGLPASVIVSPACAIGAVLWISANKRRRLGEP